MSTKINAHHSAKKLFENDSLTSKIVMDGAREQVMGKFKEACRDAMVQVKQFAYNTRWETGIKVRSERIKELQDVQ